MIQVKMVQSIEPVEGAKGIYHKITWEDGKSDFIFSPDLLKVMEKAKAGNHAVEVTKEQKGKYWNIVEARIVTTEDLPAPKEPVRKYPEPPPNAPESQKKPAEALSKAIIPKNDAETVRIRSMSLAYAKDLAVAKITSGVEKTVSSLKMIMLANQFTNWIMTGEFTIEEDAAKKTKPEAED